MKGKLMQQLTTLCFTLANLLGIFGVAVYEYNTWGWYAALALSTLSLVCLALKPSRR